MDRFLIKRKGPSSSTSSKPKKPRPTYPSTAERIIKNALIYNPKCSPSCTLMPNHPDAWFIYIRNFKKITKTVFNAFWELHPTEKKRVSSGQENRWSEFSSTDGGSFTYSGLKSDAKVIDEGSVIAEFLAVTKTLVSSSISSTEKDGIEKEAGKSTTKTSSTKTSSSSSSSTTTSTSTAPACSEEDNNIADAYNSVLTNWYQPEHTIGAHADDETDHCQGLPIFSYSLGGSRRFLIRKNTGGSPVEDILLTNGDLIVMGGTMQQHFKHEVPLNRKKDLYDRKNRINLTVRAFVKKK